jgi:hypothetical protein
MANPPLGKTTLPENAIGAPALANVNQYTAPLAIAWTGTDATNHVNVGRSSNPTTFAGFNKVTLNETSPNGPGLAFGNNQLFLAWTGADQNHSLNVISSSDGITFSNKVTLGETSGAGPSLVFLDKLYLLWSGVDQNHSLNIMQSIDGVHFTNKITLSDSSAFHPGFNIGINGSFYLAWTGRDSAHSLNTLHNVEFSSGPTNLQFKQTFSESSVAGLTVAPLEGGHELFIAWTGVDSGQHLNVAGIAAIL